MHAVRLLLADPLYDFAFAAALTIWLYLVVVAIASR